MMKIGVMGLGNIAQKAYLPVMAAMQSEVEWVLCSRSLAKGERLAAQYGFRSPVVQSPDELIARGVQAVFLHTPTPTHADLIAKFLRAGCHVYVDKPVATDMTRVRALYQLAEKQGCLLTCGFNRRFAPALQALKTAANQQLIVVEKTRVATHQEAIDALWDLAIHPLDTALWLAQGQLSVAEAWGTLTPTGELGQAYLALHDQRPQHAARVEVRVNMLAGTNLELATVQTPAGRQVVTDLRQTQTYTATGMTTQGRPDWEATLETRGFAPLIRAFVAAVSGRGVNPVSPESAMVAHEMCDDLVKAVMNAAETQAPS